MKRLPIAVLIMCCAAPAVAGVSPRDRKACLHAVMDETRNMHVIVLGTEESEANETVYVGVGAQKAKWKCLVKHGIVAEVSSMVDDGAL